MEKDLHFQSHTVFIIKTDTQMFSALISVALHNSSFKKKIICNFFNKGKFNYRSLQYIFTAISINYKVKTLYKRPL